MSKIYFFDGSDYSGKTTLIKSLVKHYTDLDKKVLNLAEPCGVLRDILLSKTSNLSVMARRSLFAANHSIIMKAIFEAKDYYDYIFIDRCSLISDYVYMSKEIDNSNVLTSTQYLMFNNCLFEDINYYDLFFALNANLVIVDLPREELLIRMYRRDQDKNDMFDSKGNGFKISIWEKYNELIADINNERCPNIKQVFNVISIIPVGNLFEDVINLVGEV